MGKTRPRLHVEQPLRPGAAVPLAASQAHYLRTVLRAQTGDTVAVFNGRDGEWQADIAVLQRQTGTLRLTEQTRPITAEPDIWLAFAPIKAARIDYLAQKATELGVSRLLPVLTERTQVRRVNTARLLANAVEAAEQCERLTVPAVDAPVALPDLLQAWPDARALVVASERGPDMPIATVAETMSAPFGLLIGPEGGLTETELDVLARRPNVSTVSLGPRILRAETAAIAALAVLQAVAGDWRTPRRS